MSVYLVTTANDNSIIRQTFWEVTYTIVTAPKIIVTVMIFAMTNDEHYYHIKYISVDYMLVAARIPCTRYMNMKSRQLLYCTCGDFALVNTIIIDSLTDLPSL